MAYEDLTPDHFKELKPQFSEVDDAIVQAYIDMAKIFVDKTWSEGSYTFAWVAMTCHLMTLDGLGSDAQSKSFATGTANYDQVKSGQLTLTRYRMTAGKGTTYEDWLKSTGCGTFYAVLLRLNRGGARILIGAVGCKTSPYAKDQLGPTYGWPGVFL